jgi:hypothetical protein
MGTLEEQLAARRERAAAGRTPEVAATLAAGIEAVRDSGLGERACKVGDAAPDFALGNATGEQIRLGELLRRGPVVLAFYRGAW